MSFVYGFLGAVGVLLIFSAGCLVGYKLRVRLDRLERRVTAEGLTETERQKLIEEQKAYNDVQNYSAETAYGLRADIT